MNRHYFADFLLRSCLFALLVMVSFNPPARGEDELPQVPPHAIAPVDTLFHKPLARGIDLVYHDQFEASLQIFDSLQREFPNHPAPYFYRAAAYQSWMSSYRFNKFQPELEENVQKAIDIGNELLEEREGDAWLNFYIGAAYGYRAFYRFRSHNWIGAYIDGKKGIGNFEDALEKEPQLYDVYLGLGSYHYWRTARSKFIRIIAFWMSDERELGIKQIAFAAEHGRYSPPEATLALVTVLYDYEKYKRALDVINEFMLGYDRQMISTLYLYGRLLVHFERWPETIATFREILGRLEGYRFPSIGYQVECKYWVAEALKEQNKTREAFELAKEALAQGERRNTEVELEGQFESFDDIKDRLQGLYEALAKELTKKP